ncbi:MAG: RNA polymerase sigma factor (sigma-70 family) [Flavobacteriaceae bacterium]|jgi:RNA polymerase sigma factor (sigma-70 family)|tara:strand:+ start:64 stop:624 length:561 start_codon:yes stop_codon:yes gene_type:complete
MKTIAENEVIKRAKKKDQTAFNILFNTYWDSVYSFLNFRISNLNLAEELAIETFAKAFDQLDKFDENQPFIAWILTIAKNHHIDGYRKSQHHQENQNKIDETTSYELSSLEPSPEDLMIADQDLELVLTHIKSLKKEYRIILKLRYFENFSYKEIEDKLNESASTVRVKIFRAKKMLASLLKKNAD